MCSIRAYKLAWIVAVAVTSLAVLSVAYSFAEESPVVPSPSMPGPSTQPATSTGPSAPASLAGRLGPGSQATAGLNLETYKLLRYDEDYSYLKDPLRRTDFLDFLKYISLGERDGFYLSLGGEARPRYEYFHNPDFGSTPADSHGNNNDLLQRYMLHGDLHLGPNVRFFGQFQSGFETGLVGGPRPDVDVDRFDVHQAFLDLVWRWSDAESNSFTLRPGRQEMAYGSARLIDVREGANLRRSFDAARMLLKAEDWQVGGFWSKPVRTRPGVFDDDPDPDRSLWGPYAVRPFSMLPDGHTDLYYLGFENKLAVYDQGHG